MSAALIQRAKRVFYVCLRFGVNPFSYILVYVSLSEATILNYTYVYFVQKKDFKVCDTVPMSE